MGALAIKYPAKKISGLKHPKRIVTIAPLPQYNNMWSWWESYMPRDARQRDAIAIQDYLDTATLKAMIGDPIQYNRAVERGEINVNRAVLKWDKEKIMRILDVNPITVLTVKKQEQRV